MAVISPQLMGSIYTGFKTIFNGAFNGIEPRWPQLATLVPSGTSEERYGWMGDLPGIREWVGDRHVQMLSTHGYTIVNREFEGTIAVKKTLIEDDQYGTFRPVLQLMGERAGKHPDKLVFEVLANGFANLCYDDKPFFHTEHTVGKKKVSNVQAGSKPAWFLLDTGSAIKPIIYQRRSPYNLVARTRMDDESVFMENLFRYGVDGRGSVGYGLWQQAFGSKSDLTPANFESAFEALQGMPDEAGEPLGVEPQLLVCGRSNRSAALKTIEALLVNGGESNINYKAVEVMVTPWLP